MKLKIIIVLVFLFFLLILFSGCLENLECEKTVDCKFADFNSSQAFFCPEDSCANQLIQAFNSADENIDIAIYSFTHERIYNALIQAKQRGVNIRVVLDFQQSQTQYSVKDFLIENNVDLRIDNKPGLMHNKFAVIDNSIVFTGSFNYSLNGDTRNDENLVLLTEPSTIQAFALEFEEIWNESRLPE
ncbi:MAG: phospholipase D family protein [archaeon]